MFVVGGLQRARHWLNPELEVPFPVEPLPALAFCLRYIALLFVSVKTDVLGLIRYLSEIEYIPEICYEVKVRRTRNQAELPLPKAKAGHSKDVKKNRNTLKGKKAVAKRIAKRPASKASK